jgi:NADPH2:quinone reductase
MMKAVVVVPGQDGPTLAVQSVREPQPGPADLLVAVKAAGVNRADLRRSQQHFAGGDLNIAGLEVAGEVIGVGPGVTGFASGDRVMGMARDGYAERAALDHRVALRVPQTMSWIDAASIPSWYLTAHDALVTNGALKPGEAVLVLGAAAGVGIAAIQVAKALGARPVIGTSREVAKLARLEQLCGLDVGIDASNADIAAATKAATGDQGAALIIDNIGASTLGAAP